jgi:hypothetical protein
MLLPKEKDNQDWLLLTDDDALGSQCDAAPCHLLDHSVEGRQGDDGELPFSFRVPSHFANLTNFVETLIISFEERKGVNLGQRR